MKIGSCTNCGTTVLPSSEGVCPACRAQSFTDFAETPLLAGVIAEPEVPVVVVPDEEAIIMADVTPVGPLEEFLAQIRPETPSIKALEKLSRVPKPSALEQWSASNRRYQNAIYWPLIIIVVLIGLRFLFRMF